MKLWLNCSNNEITFNKKNYLLRAAQRMGLEDRILDMDKHPGENYECILNIEPYPSFKKGTVWTGTWEIDMILDRHEMSLSDWVSCDTVFVANSSLPDRMKVFQGNKVVLFQACDPAVHRRIPGIAQKYDFVSAGSMGTGVYSERVRLTHLLQDTGFTFFDQKKGHAPEEYVKRINEARVQFIRSGSHMPVANTQVEQRFFECLAVGPVLKDYHSDLELLGLVEGEDYFSYKSDEEMLEKMGRLVQNLEFANQMAANGRKKAIVYHSYEARLGSILAQIYVDTEGAWSK